MLSYEKVPHIGKDRVTELKREGGKRYSRTNKQAPPPKKKEDVFLQANPFWGVGYKPSKAVAPERWLARRLFFLEDDLMA